MTFKELLVGSSTITFLYPMYHNIDYVNTPIQNTTMFKAVKIDHFQRKRLNFAKT